MSDMHFRAPNQAKWMGTRPGHNGVQVFLGAEVALVVPTSFYTVPAGQTLYLTFAFLGRANPIAANLSLSVYDDTPVLWQHIFHTHMLLNDPSPPHIASFWPPIEIPAGYHLYYNQNVNALLSYCIHGWVE